MLHIIPSDQRHHQDFGWLSARWHFSFDSYFDPENIRWGALRVFNDDVIQPGKGFGFHPHRDMEIVTVVLEGALEHRDNLGNQGVIRPGEVQVMSAGTGIVHSEYNHSQQEPVHLMQIWIMPNEQGLRPRWDQREYSPAAWQGELLPVVSNGSIPDTLTIHQDASIYRADLASNQEVRHELAPGRLGYVFVIGGALDANGRAVQSGDQVRLREESEVRLAASGPTSVLLIDVPEVDRG